MLSKNYCYTKEEMASSENIFVLGKNEEYLLELLCINGKLVIKASEELLPWCREEYKDFDDAWFTDFGNLRRPDSKLQSLGRCIADIHHYYIPGRDVIISKGNYQIKYFTKEEIWVFKDDERFD